MKIAAVPAFALLLAGAAHAQSAPPQTPPPVPGGSDVTRDLNAGPPAPAAYLAPSPAPVASDAPAPGPRSERAAPAVRPAPAPETATLPRPTPAAPVTPGEATVPSPVPPATVPSPAPGSPSPPAPTGPGETVATPAPAPAAPPAVTVLDAAARAALPFSIDLPPGFEIVIGRPGPDFRIYTIRRGDRSFAMVYAGPASQFPIYSGQMVEAGGRASVVSTEDGVRHAQEHLFQRATAPREIHVWTMSLDGADRALAERIAQSLDVR